MTTVENKTQVVQVMELKLLDGVYELFEREQDKGTVTQSLLNNIVRSGKFNFIAYYVDKNERDKYFNDIKEESAHLIKNAIRQLESALDTHKELEYTAF